MILHMLIAMVAGWVQRHQQQVITYLIENRVLKAHLDGRRLRRTDTERHRLAALARPLGRNRLKDVATIATPDTLLRWYKPLIAQKFDRSRQRRRLGRPRVAEEIKQLIIRMAEENPPWGYRRIQGALAKLTDPYDGFLLGKRYLIHDRDTKFTQAFDGLLKDSGVEPILLPPRSPNLNAHCERFVRSIKEEALAQMVMLRERSLYDATQQYLAHYHHERNHQGLDNQLIITPESGTESQRSQVKRRERLGGMLRYYYCDAV